MHAQVHAVSSLRPLDDDSGVRWTSLQDGTEGEPRAEALMLSPGLLIVPRTAPGCCRCALLHAGPDVLLLFVARVLSATTVIYSARRNGQMAQATVVDVGVSVSVDR